MSNVAIKGGATGTATYTIEAPTGNTDRTLVLPDEAGTVLTSAGVPSSALPVGSVLQVVHASTDTEAAISVTTYTDTNLSATITPTSASSTILVFVSQQFRAARDTSFASGGYRLLRDSTVIFTGAESSAGAPIEHNLSITGATLVRSLMRHDYQYEDSPNTTSAITYKTQGAVSATGNNAVMQFQWDIYGVVNATSFMTLMEIAG